MKLCEATFLGSKLKPQAFHAFSFQGATCALGAVLDAIGKLDENSYDVQPILEQWPWANMCPGCPACDDYLLYTVTGIMAHLNDEHRWTRERIADWRLHDQRLSR